MRCATGKIFINIINEKCYKCQNQMNIAWCTTEYDDGIDGTYYGPEEFSEDIIKIAKDNGVYIEERFSKTAQKSYNANICPSCGAFVGKFFIHHYLYSEDKKVFAGTFDDDKEVNMTIDYYNEYANKFSEGTLTVEFEERQNMLLKYLNTGSHILDLGCGSGRDSKAFLEKGFKVTAIDGSSELCKIASKVIGQKVICKRFKDLNYKNKFDAVWACAAILHIPSVDLRDVIFNISNALKPGGYFYTSFKYGDFEGERNGRYFTDLTKESLIELLGPFTNLAIIEVDITGDVRAGRENEKWLNVIVKKIK